MKAGKAGKIIVDVRLEDLISRKTINTKALIDTGSDNIVIPKKLTEELSVEVRGEDWVKTGGGPVKVRYGYVGITLNGHWSVWKAWINENIEKVLIGVLALESLGLKVNPKGGKLEEEEQELYALTA